MKYAWKCIALLFIAVTLSACDLEEMAKYGKKPNEPDYTCAVPLSSDPAEIQPLMLSMRTTVRIDFGVIEGRILEIWQNNDLVWTSVDPELRKAWIYIDGGILLYGPLGDETDIEIRERAEDETIIQNFAFHLTNSDLGIQARCEGTKPRHGEIKIQMPPPIGIPLPEDDGQ